MRLLNADIGIKDCSSVETFINCSGNISFPRRTAGVDRIKASGRYLQIFNHKSEVSISAGALPFYFLQATLSNVSKQRHGKLFSSERTVGTYFPARLESIQICKPYKRLVYAESGWLSNVDKLRALHGSIGGCLKPLLEIAEIGTNVVTENGQKITLHLLLPSNVAHIPGIEGLLAMKRGS